MSYFMLESFLLYHLLPVTRQAQAVGNYFTSIPLSLNMIFFCRNERKTVIFQIEKGDVGRPTLSTRRIDLNNPKLERFSFILREEGTFIFCKPVSEDAVIRGEVSMTFKYS